LLARFDLRKQRRCGCDPDRHCVLIAIVLWLTFIDRAISISVSPASRRWRASSRW
jgi:hypothetical protein